MDIELLEKHAKKQGIGKITPVEWDGLKFYVKQLTAYETVNIENSLGDLSDNKTVRMARMIANALVNEDGERVFTDAEETRILKALPAKIMGDIMEIAVGVKDSDVPLLKTTS